MPREEDRVEVQPPSINMNSTHAQRFAHLLETGEGSDVTVLVTVGRGRVEIRAHRLILMIGSGLFRRYFTNNCTSLIYLASVEYEELMIILKFLYTGQIQEKLDFDVARVQTLAEEYEIPELGEHCRLLLESKLAVPLNLEACNLVNTPAEQNTSSIADICKNGAQFVDSDDFLNLSCETLKEVLEKDSLAVYDEIQLFEAMMRWAHAETERQGMPLTSKYLRSVLENLVHLIRYPQMTPMEFSLKVATTQVLTADDILAILLYFNIPLEQRQTMTPGLFNARPRQYFRPSGKMHILKRLRRVKGSSPGEGTINPRSDNWTSSHSIKIRADTQVWISSIGVNAVSRSRSDFPGNFVTFKFKIEEPTEGKTLAKKTLNVPSLSAFHTLQHVTFDTPARLKKDVWYLATFRITAGIYIGRSYKTIEEGNMLEHVCGEKKVQFEFQNSDLSDSSTDTTQGYLPEFGFYVE